MAGDWPVVRRCSAEGCAALVKSKGLCAQHYLKNWREQLRDREARVATGPTNDGAARSAAALARFDAAIDAGWEPPPPPRASAGSGPVPMARRHIIEQLRSRLDFEEPGIIGFKDGSRLLITRRLAEAALDANDSLDPAGKAALQASMGASAASFGQCLAAHASALRSA